MKYTQFTDAERSQIKILLEKGFSQRDIGKGLGRSPSSISREIKLNKKNGKYNPKAASSRARRCRKHSKYQGMKMRERPKLAEYVKEKLKSHWTPEEIAGRLKEVDTHLPYISGKGIYKWLYSIWGQAYCYYLPRQRFEPKKRRKKSVKEHIPNRISIRERPIGANERSEFGHFEEDTMLSGKKTGSKFALAVFCERKARYTCLSMMQNMRVPTHVKTQREMAAVLKISTITYDNGLENRGHERVSQELGVSTYFCDAYSSWQKGTVENTIGRVRRFIPKGSNLSKYSEQQVKEIEHWLNHTPRKCLNFRTPHEIMTQNLRFISTSPSVALRG